MIKISPRKNSKFYRRSVYIVAELLLGIVLILTIHFLITNLIPNTERKNRIENIYTSLQLDDSYVLTRSDVFGDKRVYSWDAGRTYSSAKYYTKDATVDQTAAALTSQIEKAGFTFFEEPYPGSTYIQYHFKSDNNEYVRMTVSSKPRDDAFANDRSASGPSEAALALDPNAGPSNIIVKVNLDDNNE